MTGTVPVVALDRVTFRRGDTQILHGIDLTVRTGEHWALLGPNGAGKSTVLGFCGALTHPTTGTVHVLGERLGRVELQELRRHIGHVNPRHPLRSPLTVRDVVLTGATGTIELPLRWVPDRALVAEAEELIAEVGLAERVDARWPTLSQGERGRTLLARALLPRPRLLLLDEPSTGLDVAAREQLLTTVDDLARTRPEVATILVTHHLEELPSSTTHALLIARGRTVVSGDATEVITTAHVSAAFEHPIHVGRAEGRWSARAGRPPRGRTPAPMTA
ncbi:ABC transporter ATP-binding protein [Mumia sp. DW29H23]|uniref:ABC transporter ATP-binding protein n=1 Tax=Mumia sp. DW29H23 TaxID=3421241 RepID=UPI003D69440B